MNEKQNMTMQLGLQCIVITITNSRDMHIQTTQNMQHNNNTNKMLW